MRRSVALILPVLAWAGCSSGSGATPGDGGAGPLVDAGRRDVGAALPDGNAPDGAVRTDASTPREDAATIPPPPDAGVVWLAGNPSGSCGSGVPARGRPVDTSKPTTVVGTGTAASCTFTDLRAAVARAGIITFDCGGGAVTIPITATLSLPTDKNTVIDGGNQITLDGGNAVQIMSFNSLNFPGHRHRRHPPAHRARQRAKKTGSLAIPKATLPCSQGWDDGEGGALYMRDGNLVVIDSIFMNNHAAPLGPDTGGGAIYVLGSKSGVVIVGSTFSHNGAANAGAVGCLFTELNVYNSLFTGNMASATAELRRSDHVLGHEQRAVRGRFRGERRRPLQRRQLGERDPVRDAILRQCCRDRRVRGGPLLHQQRHERRPLSITDTTMTGNTGGHWDQRRVRRGQRCRHRHRREREEHHRRQLRSAGAAPDGGARRALPTAQRWPRSPGTVATDLTLERETSALALAFDVRQ